MAKVASSIKIAMGRPTAGFGGKKLRKKQGNSKLHDRSVDVPGGAVKLKGGNVRAYGSAKLGKISAGATSKAKKVPGTS